MTNPTVFLGSGPVAAKCLELLLEHTEVEAVITKPRANHHRGEVPVLSIADKNNLKVYTVSNKKELDDLTDNVTFISNYAVLIDFGIIVSQKAIDKFELGIINSHFSLLPQLRGADPITFSILEGAKKTGVSLMLVDKGMDTGKLITQKIHHLTGLETTPQLTEELIKLSDHLIKEYLPKYLNGEIKPKNQPHPDRATYSRKLEKSDGIIDWSQSAVNIERQIRAFIDWPQSRAKLGDLEVIVTAAHAIQGSGEPGEIISRKKDLTIATADNLLSIDKLKPAGKKEMPVEAFLSGYSSKLATD